MPRSSQCLAVSASSTRTPRHVIADDFCRYVLLRQLAARTGCDEHSTTRLSSGKSIRSKCLRRQRWLRAPQSPHAEIHHRRIPPSRMVHLDVPRSVSDSSLQLCGRRRGRRPTAYTRSRWFSRFLHCRSALPSQWQAAHRRTKDGTTATRRVRHLY